MPARLRLLLPLALLVAAKTEASASDVQRQDAVAYARTGDTVLYRESHWRYREDGGARRLVLYRCPDGRAFARKTVVERARAQAPDFDFEDARDGYREGVRSGPQGRVVYVRKGAKDAQRQRALVAPADGVIDAGFDASVRLHWDTLRAGRAVTQPFLLPSRMAFMPVRLNPGPSTRWNGIAAQRMTLRLDRWYGFVAPTMQLTYASADQRLLEFAGIATIRDGEGRHQDVRIAFPEPPAAADLHALKTAMATPLVTRCAS